MLVLKKSVAESRERYRYIAVNQSNIIRDSIDAVLARSFTLSTLVHDNDGDTAFFDRQAERIYQETKKDTGITLKNIAVAPEGIVEKAYSVAGNEALIGFDFMDDTQPGNQEAIAAYQRGELVITNPFNLIQGGDYYIDPEESTYYKMVHRADEKLYQAKESGRDQYAL